MYFGFVCGFCNIFFFFYILIFSTILPAAVSFFWRGVVVYYVKHLFSLGTTYVQTFNLCGGSEIFLLKCSVRKKNCKNDVQSRNAGAHNNKGL